MSHEVRQVIPEDHPALAGHFPGNPVIPGVVILDEVVRAVQNWQGACRLARIASVKFTAPLEPGCPFTIRLHEKDDSRIEFECLLDGRPVASGRLEIERRENDP